MAKQKEGRYAKATELAQDINSWLAEASEEAARVRRLLYVAQMNLAQMAWENNQVPRVLELLENHRPEEDEEDLRGFEWFYWDCKCHSELLTLKGHDGGVLSVAFSADGQRLASAGRDGTVKVWDASNGQEMLTLKWPTGFCTGVVFSADGQRLAWAGIDRSVKVWDARSGQVTLSLKGHIGQVTGIAFTRTGSGWSRLVLIER